MAEELDNFLATFRDKETKQFRTVECAEFLKLWQHYDQDGNGYLENEELDKFLEELVSSITETGKSECLSKAALELLKENLLEAYDEDEDGRIDLHEMAKILPMKDELLAIFDPLNKIKSSIEFIHIWRRFDQDNNGFLEGQEVTGLVRMLFERVGKQLSEQQLQESVDVILKLFDSDKDGRLRMQELSKLIKVKENFLKKPIFRSSKAIRYSDFERVFLRYDIDRNGFLENDELDAFLKDLIESTHVVDTADQSMDEIKKNIIAQWDGDSDGRIGRKELETLLLHTIRLNEDYDAIKRGQEQCNSQIQQ
ncbi:hypothetical protein Ciccas_012827 [Cichlidogyrus casuarinus]|uniref:EF-hand domain-containing protein n=1 Tax=Cichlidogyrus casuarinus TaxID=1844966 RepID=A0ABD2PQA6_9PLAT